MWGEQQLVEPVSPAAMPLGVDDVLEAARLLFHAEHLRGAQGGGLGAGRGQEWELGLGLWLGLGLELGWGRGRGRGRRRGGGGLLVHRIVSPCR